MKLDPTLLDVIACPVCHGPLMPDDVAGELVCTGCELAYPVHDDIPVLLIDHARSTSTEQPAMPAQPAEKTSRE